MERKGFTLIELLGVIIILSLIMLIAIPNISSTLERSKRGQYLADARKFVSLVEYELRKGDIDKPGELEILQITLEYLNTNDIDKGPDGVSYDLKNSYVIVARKNGYLTYFVNLVTVKDKNNKYKGIALVDSENLESNSNASGGTDTTSEVNRYNLVTNDVKLLSDTEIKDLINIGDQATINKK